MARTLSDPKPARNSGVELLKVFAIAIIVLFHVIQTFGYHSPYVPYSDYVIEYTKPSSDVSLLIVGILSYSGALGNTLFFVCSAWYLLESRKTDCKKVCFMVAEVWVISVLIALLAACNRSVPVSGKFLLYSLFPTTFGNNWYVTCYLLFYLIHAKLNTVIYSMTRQALLRAATALGVLYLVVNYLHGGAFFSNVLITWVAIYFVLAYLKLYAKPLCDNKKVNAAALVIALALNTAIIVLTNYLGLRIGFFSGRLLQGSSSNNPLLVVSAIAALNLARSARFQNRFVNTLSGLSLLIYLIHENLILATYYRPMLVRWAYLTFGYDRLLLLIFAIAAVIFLSTAAVSYLYSITLRRFVKRLGDALYRVCLAAWGKWRQWLIRP